MTRDGGKGTKARRETAEGIKRDTSNRRIFRVVVKGAIKLL